MSQLTGRLSEASLGSLARDVTRPAYDRSRLQTGIVHLGIGAFHRAHQAVMTEAAIAAGDHRWGIEGASLRSPATRDALAAQDWLYSVTARDAERETTHVVGALRGVHVAPDNPAQLIAALAAPSVKVVTLTVTEKGYHHAPSNGDLRLDDGDIQHDLRAPDTPRTMPGFVVVALRRRRVDGLPPPTLLSCDNLFANGRTLKRLLTQFAEASDPELARFIEAEVACPNSMVDRIVPATTEDDRRSVARRLGVEDAGAVVTEPFLQWVIEDHFPTGRPEWERAGAEMVDDVAPYEIMKLRLLNASHSAIAYLGAVAGYETVAEAMRDRGIALFVERLMDDEVTPALSLPGGFDVTAYKRALLARFANPALRHRTQQIAMDGSQKLPPRILETVRSRLAQAQPVGRLALVVAAWMRYVIGRDEAGRTYDIADPMRADIQARVREHGRNPADLAAALLGMATIFGRDLAANATFRQSVTSALLSLCAHGVKTTLQAGS